MGMTILTKVSIARIVTSLKEPPGEGDDPTGEEDRNHVRININPLRGEGVVRTTTETLRFNEHDTVKVPKFPTLPNLFAWKLQVGKNLVAAGGRIDQA